MALNGSGDTEAEGRQLLRLPEADDYRVECQVLNQLLSRLEETQWCQSTQFKNWTANDIIGHLHLFDVAARRTLDSADQLRAFMAEIKAGRTGGRSLAEYTCDWLRGCQGEPLRERWYKFSMELADSYGQQDPRHRVAWGGPDMSVRSCISARQMETWAHGQAIFDLVGLERMESDRLRNIAVIGVNTFAWSFVNNGLEVPTQSPRILLRSPSGAAWNWHEEASSSSIEGDALEFCQVVTQTRAIADTRLRVEGVTAKRWMAIAQCFAGPPERPPQPGTRFRMPT